MSSGNRLKLMLARGGAPVPPSPVLMNFGTKTRSGAGEVITGASASSSPTGTNATDWTVNTRSGMTPSGTYGAFKTYAAGSYTLGINNGDTVQITMQSAKAHVIAVNSGTNADTSTSFQLKTVFELGSGASGALVAGDQIVGRTSQQNPNAGNYAIDVPSGAWGATTGNPVIITSETPNTGTDADGNPIRGGGYKIGKLYFGGATGTQPVSVRNVSMYTDAAVPISNTMVAIAVAGTGHNFYQCDFRFGPSVTTISSSFGVNLKLPATIDSCHFENQRVAVLGDNGNGLTVTNTVFKNLQADGIQTGGGGHTITYNFFYDWVPPVGDHPDTVQLNPNVNVSNITISYNISVRNNGVLNLDDAQGFFTSPPGSQRFSNIQVLRNLTFLSAANACRFGRADDTVIQANTLVSDPWANTTLHPALIKLTDSGVNATVTHNIVNGIDLSGQTGTVVSTPNATISFPDSPNSGQIATYLAALTVMFPNMATHVPGTLTNREAVLHLLTPADLLVASGGAMNPDGTANGALFPAVAPATIGAWNDLSVYDPGNPAWVAAHPPAT